MTGMVDYRSPQSPKPLEVVTLDVAHIIPHNLAQSNTATEMRIFCLRFLTVG